MGNKDYRIIYDNRTFQISDVRRFDAIGNTTYLIECATKKYCDGTAWNTSLTEDLKTTATPTPVKSLPPETDGDGGTVGN